MCRNDAVREKVNGLLALGASYAQVVRALAADNAELDKCDRVTVDSVRTHCRRHFPVQSFAKATYREILERRARENQIDFVEGVATALHPHRERSLSGFWFTSDLHLGHKAMASEGTGTLGLLSERRVSLSDRLTPATKGSGGG